MKIIKIFCAFVYFIVVHSIASYSVEQTTPYLTPLWLQQVEPFLKKSIQSLKGNKNIPNDDIEIKANVREGNEKDALTAYLKRLKDVESDQTKTLAVFEVRIKKPTEDNFPQNASYFIKFIQEGEKKKFHELNSIVQNLEQIRNFQNINLEYKKYIPILNTNIYQGDDQTLNLSDQEKKLSQKLIILPAAEGDQVGSMKEDDPNKQQVRIDCILARMAIAAITLQVDNNGAYQSFYHADPHTDNFFVTLNANQVDKITFIDFLSNNPLDGLYKDTIGIIKDCIDSYMYITNKNYDYIKEILNVFLCFLQIRCNDSQFFREKPGNFDQKFNAIRAEILSQLLDQYPEQQSQNTTTQSTNDSNTSINSEEDPDYFSGLFLDTQESNPKLDNNSEIRKIIEGLKEK